MAMIPALRLRQVLLIDWKPAPVLKVGERPAQQPVDDRTQNISNAGNKYNTLPGKRSTRQQADDGGL